MCNEFYSNYTIINKIGEGTFSDVSKCQRSSTGQILAVKKLKKQFNNIREALSLPELLVLDKLPPHPNVLPLLEYIFDLRECKLFMIFELMEMSLYDMIQSRSRCLPETRVKHMTYQILKGIEHLHIHGIFHRDIKPENILVKREVVKLADLGSVRGVYSQPPYTEYISTRWYRAPECILTEGAYGPKMDVWACGCVFYELLTSKPIFPGDNEIDQLTKIHQIVGTPNTRVMLKLRQQTSRVGDIRFAAYPSLNLATFLPFTSEGGRALLKNMLVYDPDVRSNVRRLLEHRYFNNLREAEYMIRQGRIPRERGKPRSNPLMLGLLNTGNKLKANREVQPKEKKKNSTKLTTNSWAPSTNTSKVGLTQSKSKPNHEMSIKAKRRPNQSPVKRAIKLNPTVKPHSKPAVKEHKDKIKSNTLGALPAIHCKQGGIQLKKTQLPSSNLRAMERGFLPSIPEQKEVC